MTIDLTGHDNYQCLYLNGELIRKGARSDKRLRMIDWLCIKDKRVLDIGCNAGLFAREAKQRGAAEVIGVDKGEVINVARRLAEAEGLDIDFRQMDVESEEFRELAMEGFDIVFACAVHTHIKGDRDAFLQLVDRAADSVLFFESNFKTSPAMYKGLLETWMTFDVITELGASGDPTLVDIYPGREVTDFYLFRCSRRAVPADEQPLPIADFRMADIDAADKLRAMWNGPNVEGSHKRIAQLKESIARNGLRIPLTLQWKRERWQLWEGGHRFVALQELGLEIVPCRYRGKAL